MHENAMKRAKATGEITLGMLNYGVAQVLEPNEKGFEINYESPRIRFEQRGIVNQFLTRIIGERRRIAKWLDRDWET